MKLRKLEEHEVEFELSTESEDTSHIGECSAVSDEVDKAAEEDISRRLAHGDESAWCVLVVKATWKGYSETDYLGGFTFPEGNNGRQNQKYAADSYADMKEEVLERLNKQLSERTRIPKDILELVIAE